MTDYNNILDKIKGKISEGDTVILIESDDTEHYSELYGEEFTVVGSYGGNTVLRTSDDMYLDIEKRYLINGIDWRGIE